MVAPQPDSDAILRCFFKKKEFFCAGTLITRAQQMKLDKISENPFHLCHPCSILIFAANLKLYVQQKNQN
jgi:hypothetical protein